MLLSGELIRMMNYVDDISATLRRIAANTPSITDDERKRLVEYMKKAEPNFNKVVESFEKGQ